MLRDDSRVTFELLSKRLDIPVARVQEIVSDLEKKKAIVAYKAIVNPEVVDDGLVDAIIQVKVTPKRGHGFDEIARRIGGFPQVDSLYLMSGGSDFLVFMHAPSIKEIALFVTDKLSTLDDIQSTMTHFILKEYKKDGTILSGVESADRLAVSP
jgi:DNA-binding Lrp family transcriptional regulator